MASALGSRACDEAPLYKEGFAIANGVRLQYFEWGTRSKPVLILIHGGMDNPHAFDDLAPALSDEFHVIAYARRSHGRSQVKGPYDTNTLTDDLLALMDRLHIGKAHLAGWSMGGNEVTGLASRFPARVERIVYLDGAFDFADPTFLEAFKAIPTRFMNPPESAMVSFEAYRSYHQAEVFAPLKDMQRVEAYLRETVVIQPNGSVKHSMAEAIQQDIFKAVLADPPRQYHLIRCPVLAIFPHSQFNLHGADPQRREEALECERAYMAPMREKFMKQIGRDLPDAQIVRIPGAHSDFFLNSKDQVAALMLRFLRGSER